MRKLLPVFAAAMLLVSACQHTLTSYVNPFVGTGGHGHTFPGAILPFGMVQPGPDTRLDGWDGCSGYHYSDDTIFGFSHTHLSGTGVSDYGDLLLMPFSDDNGPLPDSLGRAFYASPFSHRNEEASPGYYRVVLDRNRIMAEMTVHDRNAIHRYSFPHPGTKGIVVDLDHRDVVLNSRISVATDDEGRTVVAGHRTSSAWNPQQHFAFAITADKEVRQVLLYSDGRRVDNATTVNGTGCKAVILFADDVREVTLFVGISAVDEHGAANNLKASDGLSFAQARKKADQTWEEALARFEVEGGSRDDRRVFYTALYHCMTSPYLYSDADGRYRAMNAADTNYYPIERVAEGHSQYTVFSLWDTYRALHPLLNISDPARSRDFVLTFLDHYRHSGELTMWELASHETHCMIGYHAAPVILDALRTGVLDSLAPSTLDSLLDAMVATSNLATLGRQDYARDRYLSSELENESVSKTLEYAYDDWCIAQTAAILADTRRTLKGNDELDDIRRQYTYRSQAWKNIIDSDGFMHPRRNGAFILPFDPTEVNNHFTEANSWQYSTYVPHDVQGWAAMLGGDAAALRFVDSLFYGHASLSGRDQSDITGLIGLYAHGNEPSHHAAYLYACLGQQWKTARLVRDICLTLYSDAPDGLCGNEDCGQMSAWYVMSALGFYPLCPGSGQYIIGSPLFDRAVIHLPGGNDIVINASNQSHDNCYIQSVKVDGVDYDKAYLTVEQLLGGCTIDVVMCPSPESRWASAPQARPAATMPDTLLITPAPVFGDWQQGFEQQKVVTIAPAHNASQCSIFYTLDGSTPTTLSTPYDGTGITVTSDAVVKAVAYSPSTGLSNVVTHRLTLTPNDKKLTYITNPDPQYCENGPAGLIDRLHGTENYRIGGWQGWQSDAILLVDLLEPRTIASVGVECLEHMRSWIFFPKQVEIEVSDDNATFRPFGTVVNNDFQPTHDRQELSTMHNFAVNATPTYARYVRITVRNFGTLPQWHISANQQAWLFIDEISIQ